MGWMAEWSLELEADRSRRFRRLLWVSAAVHGFVVLGLMSSPRPARLASLPAVVQVELHAALPAASPPPKEAPKPKAPPKEPPPVVPPKPKPPVPEKVVIPEKPKPLPEPKPKPKAKPAVASKPVEKPPPTPAKEEESYDDFLDALRAEREAKSPPTKIAAVQGPSGPSGPGIVLPADVVVWMRRAKVHVTRAWVLAPSFRTLSLETEIAVRVGRSGVVEATRITRRSGNPWFDESVERAIRKASPLPEPPEAEEWSFVFRPEDLF